MNNLIDNLPASFTKDPASLLLSHLDAVGSEVFLAATQVLNALDQMSTTTADGEWLDEWGGYFGIPRNSGEPDRYYGSRIIAEVIRPRENNVAIASAIRLAFGQEASVIDSAMLDDVSHFFDGVVTYDGTHLYNASILSIYGLFDVTIDYNLESSLDQSQYAASVRQFIEKFRAAGTHMRSLFLGGTVFGDAVDAAADAAAMTVHRATHYDGAFKHNRILDYSGDFAVDEVLS